jgi:hypothetical protein
MPLHLQAQLAFVAISCFWHYSLVWFLFPTLWLGLIHFPYSGQCRDHTRLFCGVCSSPNTPGSSTSVSDSVHLLPGNTSAPLLPLRKYMWLHYHIACGLFICCHLIWQASLWLGCKSNPDAPCRVLLLHAQLGCLLEPSLLQDMLLTQQKHF